MHPFPVPVNSTGRGWIAKQTKQWLRWLSIAAAPCAALVLASCAGTQLSGSKRDELAYVEQVCSVQPIVGDAKGVALKIDAQHEKLQSAKGHITVEKYRRLSQDLKDYNAKWELLHQTTQMACRVWALCQFRQTVAVVNGCEDEREAMERGQKAVQDFQVQLSIEVQIRPSAETPPPVENRIFLYERYGGEWHTSNKEPILFVNNQAVLRNKFGEGREYRFTPTVHNGSKTVTLVNPVQLYINLPTELKVKKPSLWVIADVDNEFTQYTASIPADIPPGTGNTLNESLFIVFPRPGRYRSTYSIHGTTSTGEGFATERRAFDFVLTE